MNDTCLQCLIEWKCLNLRLHHLNFIIKQTSEHAVIHLLLGLKLGFYVPEKTLAAFRPKTDEAQQGVNAFGIVSCGFSVLSAAHIFASVNNKMYQ